MTAGLALPESSPFSGKYAPNGRSQDDGKDNTADHDHDLLLLTTRREKYMRDGITVRYTFWQKGDRWGQTWGRDRRDRDYKRKTDGSGLCRECFQIRDLESDPRGCACVVLSVFWIAFQEIYFLLEQVAVASGAPKFTTWWHQITKTFCRDGPRAVLQSI